MPFNICRVFILSNNGAKFDSRIAGYYIENQSGTKLERPVLNKLIDDS